MSKEEFVQALKSEGLDASFANNGVPTVFVENPLEINKVNKMLKSTIKELGYTESYGISIKKAKEPK